MSAKQTESQRKTQRYYLEIQHNSEVQVAGLIRDARKLVDDLLAQHGNRWQITPTQVSNLNGVCAEAVTVEEVVGFVQYQIGREISKGGATCWALGFGEALIKALTALQTQAQGIVSAAFKKFTPEGMNEQQERERVWLLLAQQYVGHLRRYVTYKRPGKEG